MVGVGRQASENKKKVRDGEKATAIKMIVWGQYTSSISYLAACLMLLKCIELCGLTALQSNNALTELIVMLPLL